VTGSRPSSAGRWRDLRRDDAEFRSYAYTRAVCEIEVDPETGGACELGAQEKPLSQDSQAALDRFGGENLGVLAVTEITLKFTNAIPPRPDHADPGPRAGGSRLGAQEGGGGELPDGRFAAEFNAMAPGFKLFDKIQTVQPAAIVDNKRLSAVLEQIKE
jgi:hypothetical protein